MVIDTIHPPVRERAPLQEFSDAELVQEVVRRAARERHATADLIRGLIEFDRRELFLSQGYASLYAYCTQALHYSEYGAFNRIEVARAAARWPQLLAALEDGSVHLTGARLLAPHLTEDNIESAIASARHKSKRDIEEIAAGLAQRNVVVAVGAVQYRLHLTISRAALDTLRQVQALMGHQFPRASETMIFEQAITLLLQKLERQRFAATDRPREASGDEPVTAVASVPPVAAVPSVAEAPAPAENCRPEDPRDAGASARHIRASVRRAVWKRDEARCAFVGVEGRRTERSRLEFHHLVPFAAGGQSTIANIELRCRAHNVYEAKVYFGDETIATARERRSSRESPSADSKAETGDAARPGASPGQEVDPDDDLT